LSFKLIDWFSHLFFLEDESNVLTIEDGDNYDECKVGFDGDMETCEDVKIDMDELENTVKQLNQDLKKESNEEMKGKECPGTRFNE